MTGQQLRDALDRIGAEAPVARVAPDTWARARRARRRERVAGIAGAVAAVAVLAGISVAVLPRSTDAPVAGGELAVPDHLYAVPARDVDQLASDDLAVGVGAVAWLTDQDAAVVVDAAAGGYHVLRLPGLADTLPTGAALAALSPDGTRLAYPRADGVTVVDLRDGSLVVTDLAPAPLVIDRLVWSPAGVYLAWEGRQVGGGVGAPSATRAVVGGVVDASGTPARRALPQADHALSVDDAGAIGTYTVPTDGTTPRGGFAPEGAISPVAVARADGTLLVGVGTGPDEVVATVVDRDSGTTTPAATGTTAGLGSVPLGWSADGLPLVSVKPEDPGEVLLGGDDTRTVTTADDGVPLEISVATDLVSADEPSVTRPEPDWPWHWPAQAAPIAGALAMLAAAIVFVAVQRRRASTE